MSKIPRIARALSHGDDPPLTRFGEVQQMTTPAPISALPVRSRLFYAALAATLPWLLASFASAQDKKPPAKADDPVAVLETARTEHAKALEDAQKKLMQAVDDRLKYVKDQGDLKALEKLLEVKKSLEADNKLPEGVKDNNVLSAVRLRDRAVEVANSRVLAAYDRAVRDLTKAGKIDEAKALQKEKDAFGASKPGGDENAAQWFQFGGRAGLPGFLQPSAGAFNTKEGLRCRNNNILVHSRAAGFLSKNFTVDLVYSFENDNANKIMLFGIGDPAGNAPNGAFFRIHGPEIGEGEILLTTPKGTAAVMGRIKTKGTHLARIEKKDDVVTFAVCMNYEGKFSADFTHTVTSLKEFVPTMTEKTTRVFFGYGGTFKQVRLTIVK
jgi:hypothetical protein